MQVTKENIKVISLSHKQRERMHARMHADRHRHRHRQTDRHTHTHTHTHTYTHTHTHTHTKQPSGKEKKNKRKTHIDWLVCTASTLGRMTCKSVVKLYNKSPNTNNTTAHWNFNSVYRYTANSLKTKCLGPLKIVRDKHLS